MPVNVVEPVPPRRTANVPDAETRPLPSTTREPLDSPVRYVLPFTVNAVVEAYSNMEVEEAERAMGEPRIHIWVEVEFASCPKLVVGVKENDPASLLSHKSEEPVMVEQKSVHPSPVTLLKVRRPVMSILVDVAFVVEADDAWNELGKITWFGRDSVQVLFEERS